MNAQDPTLNSGGDVFVAGRTTSTDFPTQSACDAAYGGNGDAFVAKIVQARNDVVLDFGAGAGVWVNYNNNPAAWGQIHGSSPEGCVAGSVD